MGLFDEIKRFLQPEQDYSREAARFREGVESGTISYDGETQCGIDGAALCSICGGCKNPLCSTKCTCGPEES